MDLAHGTISDLEYRIRQQTEFYKQIRAAKGAVTLGRDLFPKEKDPIREVKVLIDDSGRKIHLKEPLRPETDDDSNDKFEYRVSQTRPVKPVRRRRILMTKNLYKSSNQAAILYSSRSKTIIFVSWIPFLLDHHKYIIKVLRVIMLLINFIEQK